MILRREYRKYILILAGILLFAAAGWMTFAGVRAEEPLTLDTAIELPSSYLEYRKLNAPRDIYYDDEVTAILQADNTIVLFRNGAFAEIGGNSNLSKVRRAGNALIIQQGASVMTYSLSEGGALQNAMYDDGTGVLSPLAYSAFDVNDRYLVAYAGTQIDLFSITYGADGIPVFVEKRNLSSAAGDVNHIALNDQNDVFFFDKSNKLSYFNVETPGNVRSFGNFTTPTGIVADDANVYIANEQDGLLRVSVADGTQNIIVQRAVEETTLEDLVAPAGLALKDGNVLVCDTACNKVVEYGYDAESGRYGYSGFAITTTAEAYNRLTVSTPSIALAGERKAVLNGNGVLYYDGNKYRTFSLTGVGNATEIALGNDYAALIAGNRLLFLNLTDGTLLPYGGAYSAAPMQLAYANGIYYFSTYTYPDTTVFQVSEASVGGVLSESETALIKGILIDDFVTDIDGNLYYLKDDVVRPAMDTDRLQRFSEKPVDIGVDLNGNVYALLSDNRVEYYKDGVLQTKTLTVHGENLPSDAKASAMAMNFDNEKIYFLFNGYGFILSTSEAENASITDIAVPADFTLTGESATDAAEFRIVIPETGKNLYLIENAVSDVFSYRSLAHSDGREYVYGGETETFFILLGEENALVKKSDATIINAYNAAADRRAYTATSVCLYYYPILTDDGRYALVDTDRLPSKCEISVAGTISVNGRTFYFTTYQGVYGYIPADFLTFELAQTPENERFSYRTLNAGKNGVTVFADEALSAVAEILYENIQVKAFATGTENVYYVEYTRADGSLGSGYVIDDSFLVNGAHAIRNAVILILVALSVTVTSFYFINRKQKSSARP